MQFNNSSSGDIARSRSRNARVNDRPKHEIHLMEIQWKQWRPCLRHRSPAIRAAPMSVLARSIKHALNVAVQRSHDADPREHRWLSQFGDRPQALNRGLPTTRCTMPRERTVRDLRRRFNFGCTRLQSAAALLDEASADCMLCLFSKEKMGEGRQKRRHDADKQNGSCCASPSDA
jgi:hypothetical protein